MQIRFLGAAGEVTGSCFEVRSAGCRFLVDCGLFQGGREADRKNREALDFDVRELDFVILTHAHIDHSGLLPRLTMLGFRGPVYCTPPTADLLGVMLPDSAYIQEKEVEWETRHRRREQRRQSIEEAPLYTVAQAFASLKQLRRIDYGETFTPHSGVRARFRDAGHILGSAFVEVWIEEGSKTRKLAFSGDLGQPGHPLMRDPDPLDETDVLVMESTYGNRLHKPMPETLDELSAALTDTLAVRGGNVVIPAFAVGRTRISSTCCCSCTAKAGCRRCISTSIHRWPWPRQRSPSNTWRSSTRRPPKPWPGCAAPAASRRSTSSRKWRIP